MLILVHMNLLMSKRKAYSKKISPILNTYFYRKIILGGLSGMRACELKRLWVEKRCLRGNKTFLKTKPRAYLLYCVF